MTTIPFGVRFGDMTPEEQAAVVAWRQARRAAAEAHANRASGGWSQVELHDLAFGHVVRGAQLVSSVVAPNDKGLPLSFEFMADGLLCRCEIEFSPTAERGHRYNVVASYPPPPRIGGYCLSAW